MQLIIEARSFEHAQFCIKQNCSHLIVGNHEFALRQSYSFTQDEILSLIKSKQTTKLWVKVNAFFFEQNIAAVTTYLQWLASIGIDYVIFQDYAIAEIKTELNLNLNLHYNPESLVTSHGQFDFFVANEFTGCFLAREMNLTEVQTICQHKRNLQLEIQGFGFGLIMHSRWNLISNFEHFYQTQVNATTQSIWIKEKLRKIPNLVFEDQHGTHMLTGYLINALEKIEQLADAGVDLYSLNFLRLDTQLVNELTMLFISIMQDLNTNHYQANKSMQTLSKIINNRYQCSAGFLDNITKLPHLEKDTSHE